MSLGVGLVLDPQTRRATGLIVAALEAGAIVGAWIDFGWIIATPLALLALVVALALQVAVNYANDYSDGRRGTDADRVGPMRLVGSGAATARSVLVAAALFAGSVVSRG